MPTDWNILAAAALERIEEDRWTLPAAKYLDVLDDVVAGGSTASDLAKTHGSSDLVETALGHATTGIQGHGIVKPLGAGG